MGAARAKSRSVWFLASAAMLVASAVTGGSEFGPESGAAGTGSRALPDLVVTEVPAGPGAGPPEPCIHGSRLVRLGPSGIRTLLSGSLTACDPALDAAAERLVFRGREDGSAPWRIWWMTMAAGAEPAPLTSGDLDCRRPIFLTDGVAAVCDGDLHRIADTGAAPDALPTVEALAEPVRLTSSGGGVEAAQVVPDGRLLLETREAEGVPVLLTSQPDGTWATRWRDEPVPGLQAFRPVRLGDSGDGVLLATTVRGSSGLWLGSLSDPFAPLRPILPTGGAGRAPRDPSVLGDGQVLVSLRPGPGAAFRVYRIGPAGGGSPRPEEIARAEGHALQPVAVAPRTPDTALPGIVKPELNTGYLVLFDAARSDEPELAGLGRSEISAVRIFPWDDGPRGETAVDLEPAADGSLHLEVPSDRPYGMALVGADGELLGPAGGPLWVRPNERRACMGCHVSRRYAPPNVRPEALRHPPRWVGWGAERRGPRSEFEEGSH